MPESLKIIGDYAFCNCYKLREIVLPEGVTVIGDRAFSGCFSLEKFTPPKSVIEIGREAFEGCFVTGNRRFFQQLLIGMMDLSDMLDE